MATNELVLSSLPKTWVLDLDGTLVKHNGYLIDGKDTLLKNSVEFIRNIPLEDKIVILTARSENERGPIITFLEKNNIRFNEIIFDMPTGERILINDKKPSGLLTAFAINIVRDKGIDLHVQVDSKK